ARVLVLPIGGLCRSGQMKGRDRSVLRCRPRGIILFQPVVITLDFDDIARSRLLCRLSPLSGPDNAFCGCPGTNVALRLEELTTSHDNDDNGFATRTAQ